MSKGRNTQLVKQQGEYLVACELARRGYLVATFAGNIPDFDLIATDFRGKSCPIQVKTVRGGSWQFSVDRFVHITFDGDKQKIGPNKQLPVPQLVCVFVIVSQTYGGDQFYLLEMAKVQDILVANHKNWLDLHGGKRPNKAASMHCSIKRSDLLDFKDNWGIITSNLETCYAKRFRP